MISPRLARTLLTLATTGLAGCLVCGVGWLAAATSPPRLSELSTADRRVIAESMLHQSPGIFEVAWFEPLMGYTLRPSAELEAWDDRFTANELGYRTHPGPKPREAYRVVFVGDSWTYGMGVSWEESFPQVFERLANAHAGLGRPIQAWSLALPGYSTVNEVTALWYLYDVLQPDAVVLCPTTNDHESTCSILPNGSQWREGLVADPFGDPHLVTYRIPRFDSFRWRERWRQTAAALHDAEDRLADRRVPTMTVFTAIWGAAAAHGLVAESGLSTPYLLIPAEYNLGPWALPQPIGHGTPAAYELYGRWVYQGLAEVLGWPRLPTPAEGTPDPALHRAPPSGTDWVAARTRDLRRVTADLVPTEFRATPESWTQAAGPLEPETGTIGRSTTILVRRAEGSRSLRVTLRRLRHVPSLYPLRLSVTIPSSEGGLRVEREVFRDSGSREVVELAIPPDIPVGAALDVVLEVDRVARSDRGAVAVSVAVESISQS